MRGGKGEEKNSYMLKNVKRKMIVKEKEYKTMREKVE
jgi:hypothetical protein